MPPNISSSDGNYGATESLTNLTISPIKPNITNHEHNNESIQNNSSQLHETLKTLAGVAGNVLEWYDFAVFGYFSDVLGQVFFPPHQSSNVHLMESFAVFGGAFVMRPIGGVLMGYLGDLYGRKRALEVSIFLMAIPTFLMGCLPTYQQVGAWSYISLILIRLLQGLSVGGQLMSSLVFTLESKPKRHWGYYGSFVLATANFGTLLGGVVGYWIRSHFSEQAVLQYGWRIPFLSGILVSVCGLYLKYYCTEDESFHGHHCADAGGSSNVPKNPIRLALQRENLRPLLAACFPPMLWSGGFYLVFVWMAIFMANLIPSHPYTVEQAFGINSLALLTSVCLLFPLAGILSDWYGRRRIMTIGGVLLVVAAPFLVMGIGLGNNWVTFGCQSMLGICLSLWGAPMMAWLVESFPPEARLTSVAIGYNIGQAIMGGSAPALATWLVDQYGHLSPGFLLTFLGLIALMGLWCIVPTGNSSSSSGGGGKNGEKSRLLESFETADTYTSGSENSSEESRV